MSTRNLILSLALMLAAAGVHAKSTTEIRYLSGTGAGDTRTWDFFCTAGMNSGKWTSIEVPSQWEQQGFGAYTYGRFYLDKEARPSDETGLYRMSFSVPSEWKGKSVEIVFEGSMTDTDVKINGRTTGKTHRGAFTEFSYDISDKLHYGKGDNLLEVKVSKESSDASVNAAERRADWWLFGGIYRPVYLKAVPRRHIDRVAVDARHDGTLSTTLFTAHAGKGASVDIELRSVPYGETLGKQNRLVAGDSCVVVTEWNEIRTWDCEHPNLYDVTYTLNDAKGKPLHSLTERIGFRTIEFRPKDGIYLNGTKLLIKGVNRHCFHPETGRTLNRQISLDDARLIKQMNMNAVRSHYAPDRHFLEICDSIGLLYLDEFPGWQDSYSTEAGLPLLREHVIRDVNHPSVFLWSNGNEGGWNTSLDGIFGLYDPQGRHVVHPWGDFNGIDTHHYPSYQTGPAKLANGWKVFMPTEFLHARYDKGAGSGLEDYWESYRRNPMFAGGFIWAFCDEAVARTDKEGWLDSDGSNGCDGIVGPYREKEGSFYTVRDIWAPVQFAPMNVTPSFDGKIFLTNDYLFTNFNECSMKYRTYSVSHPSAGGIKTQLAEGDVALPPIAPGESGRASFSLPDGFEEADILEIEMFGPDGETVVTRTWPIKFADEYHALAPVAAETAGNAMPSVTSAGNEVVLEGGSVRVVFDRISGLISKVESGNRTIPLSGGPLPVGMRAKVISTSTRMEGGKAVLGVKYTGGVDSIVWSLDSDGILAMDAVILNRPDYRKGDGPAYDARVTNLGLTFNYPEQEVKGMKWLGQGPYRVWKNRTRGANFGCWHKDYNNTVTGYSFGSLIYPEFKGYHGSLYWAVLEGHDRGLTVSSLTDGLYFRVFTPYEPKDIGKDDRMEPFPEGDLSFLVDINAMRSFKPVSQHGPRSQPSSIRIKPGDEGVRIRLAFGFDNTRNPRGE